MPGPPLRPRFRSVRLSAACAALCAAALLGACGGGGTAGDGATGSRTSVTRTAGSGAAGSGAADRTRPPAAAPESVRDIAAAIGCTADVYVDADELRQAGCRTERGEFRMVTFAADSGQRAWLSEARAYGGTYLVGKRWVVTARPVKPLAALRAELGGTIEAGADHHDHGGHSPPRPSP
ncbi:hypothetical protein [Streptomyces sp. XD-27]|uniref:hypothetical protein n=1 Tax=Streptomyces sp. XD-27 TaxID=3062779 RepID=UPI0026F429BF|nr:hypothetical protein [Streptomyces sp. XD-27]WKX68863.1 hypothetical protein Q3Y56_02070 [Streptomyces sp. XD-27]